MGAGSSRENVRSHRCLRSSSRLNCGAEFLASRLDKRPRNRQNSNQGTINCSKPWPFCFWPIDVGQYTLQILCEVLSYVLGNIPIRKVETRPVTCFTTFFAFRTWLPATRAG